MANELIFVIHSILIGLFAILALKINKEALIVLLCIQALLSNLFVTKQIMILGLCATCADVFSVGSSICLNLLQEYFGQSIAKKAIWLSFFSLFFYLVMTQIHLLYMPTEFDLTHIHFSSIFEFAPRLIIVSLISYVISQQLDTILYGYFRTKFAGKYFILRNYGSLLISQLFDTAFFTIFGLYKIMPNLFQVFIISYLIKVLIIFLSIPIVAICKKLIKFQ